MAVKHTMSKVSQEELDLMDRVSHQASPLYTNACLDSIDDQLKTIVNQNRAIIGILRDILNVEFHN